MMMRHRIIKSRLRRPLPSGFTLIEVLVTLVCLAIAAAVVLPTVSDNSGDRLRGAAQMLAADLEYAQSESMSHGADPRLFIVDADKLGYRITTTSAPAVPITNKVGNDSYITRFGTGRASPLVNVKVGAYSLGGDNRLGFASLGQLDQATPATIQLLCGSRSITLTIDPTTGEVTIGTLQ
jgi:prepilin-type N-terminal cleavage/methylation domain-containing protein